MTKWTRQCQCQSCQNCLQNEFINIEELSKELILKMYDENNDDGSVDVVKWALHTIIISLAPALHSTLDHFYCINEPGIGHAHKSIDRQL